jgi:hypothetical protein
MVSGRPQRCRWLPRDRGHRALLFPLGNLCLELSGHLRPTAKVADWVTMDTRSILVPLLLSLFGMRVPIEELSGELKEISNNRSCTTSGWSCT